MRSIFTEAVQGGPKRIRTIISLRIQMLVHAKVLIQPQWDMIAIPLFLLTSLGWDTLAYFFGYSSKPILPSHCVRLTVSQHERSSNLGKLLFFRCVTWAVLMDRILIPTATFTGPDHPFSVMRRQVQGARKRIERLNEAVELTPNMFWQFQMLKGKILLKETQEKMKNEGHGCDSELIDENEFLMRTRSYLCIMVASFLTASMNLILKFMRGAIFCA
jgi:hypothetical protein